MKFVSVRDLRNKSAQVWKQLAEEREMIITSNGRPIAIIAATKDSDLEESLSAFRQARTVKAVVIFQKQRVKLPAHPVKTGQARRHFPGLLVANKCEQRIFRPYCAS